MDGRKVIKKGLYYNEVKSKKDVQEAKVAKGLFGLIKFDAGSKSTYRKATAGEMKDFETYSDFSISTSTSTVWVYDGKSIPKLSASIKD